MEESWRVSASLPLPLAPLRALEVRVTASSGRWRLQLPELGALPDPITAGGAQPHIQTSFTRDLNIGNKRKLRQALRMFEFNLHDSFPFTWGQ